MKTAIERRAALWALVLLSGCFGGAPELVRVPSEAPSEVLITSTDVLDVTNGAVLRARDVLIRDGNIASITAEGGSGAGAEAQRIDGRGATLLPGLIDAHGHTGNSSAPAWVTSFPDPAFNLRAYLYCGVTTVLDPADLSNQAFARRDKIAAGKLPGPTVYATGPIFTAPGGHPSAVMRGLAPWWLRWYLLPRFTREVDGAEQARAAVAEVAALGADFIKVAVDRVPLDAPRISEEALEAIVDEAARHGLRTVVHIGDTEDAIAAGTAGAAAWVHGVYKERIPDDKIARLAAFGIPMVTTTEVFDSYARLQNPPRVATALEREIADASQLSAFDEPPSDDPRFRFFASYFVLLRAQRPHWYENVRRLHEAGTTILAGSDMQSGVLPGAGLHRELSQLTAAGLSPYEAIRAATFDTARFLERSDTPDFGIVAPGARADLLLVEGDPSTDIEAVSRIRNVIKNGVVLVRTPVGG